MIKTKKIAAIAAALAASALIAGSASAVPLVPTIYAGAGASWVSVDDSQGGVSYDDDMAGWKGFAGIQNEFGLPGLSIIVGLEGQYSDLGEFDFSGGGFTGDASGETWGLSARAGVELIETITLFARAGAHFWDVSGSGTDGINTLRISDDGTDFFFGAGGEVGIGPFMGLRAEWERYNLNDDEVDVGTVSLFFKLF